MKRKLNVLIILLLILLTACGYEKQLTQKSGIISPMPTATTSTPMPTESTKSTELSLKETVSPTSKVEHLATNVSKHVYDKQAVQKTDTPNTGINNVIENKEVISVSVLDENDSIILVDTEVEYKEGISAFDALKAATLGRIDIKLNGKGMFVYVKSIGELKEFGKGSMSGWLYYVNGVRPDKGAGSFKLNAGDKVVWKYTVDGQK